MFKRLLRFFGILPPVQKHADYCTSVHSGACSPPPMVFKPTTVHASNCVLSRDHTGKCLDLPVLEIVAVEVVEEVVVEEDSKPEQPVVETPINIQELPVADLPAPVATIETEIIKPITKEKQVKKAVVVKKQPVKPTKSAVKPVQKKKFPKKK